MRRTGPQRLARGKKTHGASGNAGSGKVKAEVGATNKQAVNLDWIPAHLRESASPKAGKR